MAKTRTVMDEYKITNGHVKWQDETESENLGCIGKLELETELKTITKKCEGDEVLSVDIPTKQTGTLSLHMSVEIARKVFGLTNDGLKEGVFSYGTNSRPGTGCFTFDVLDIYEQMKKLLALPNVTISGGYKWSLENGQEEIAEIELSFQSLKDENNKFLYQALEDEVKDEEVKTQWHKAFTPDLVKAITPPTGKKASDK